MSGLITVEPAQRCRNLKDKYEKPDHHLDPPPRHLRGVSESQFHRWAKFMRRPL
ncbi:hypothetical protein J6590_011425 [Homalodisca vitripennis]|nr:hypothetical protein J6590_011425 [Homalodisca vitripennis]